MNNKIFVNILKGFQQDLWEIEMIIEHNRINDKREIAYKITAIFNALQKAIDHIQSGNLDSEDVSTQEGVH